LTISSILSELNQWWFFEVAAMYLSPSSIIPSFPLLLRPQSSRNPAAASAATAAAAAKPVLYIEITIEIIK
jgi:hypothetical protein